MERWDWTSDILVKDEIYDIWVKNGEASLSTILGCSTIRGAKADWRLAGMCGIDRDLRIVWSKVFEIVIHAIIAHVQTTRKKWAFFLFNFV